MSAPNEPVAVRLSLPPRSVAPERQLTATERATLVRAADALIPGAQGDPKPSQTTDYDVWLDRAVAARAESFTSLVAVIATLEGVSSEQMWEALRRLSEQEQSSFHLLSSVVAGAYVMVPAVMERIGYPGQKKNPAPVDLAFEQLSDGVLDPVIERGPIYRRTSD